MEQARAKGHEGLANCHARGGGGAQCGWRDWEDARRRHATGDALGQVPTPMNPRRNASAFRAAAAAGGTGWIGGAAIVAKVVGVWRIGGGFAERAARDGGTKKSRSHPCPSPFSAGRRSVGHAQTERATAGAAMVPQGLAR